MATILMDSSKVTSFRFQTLHQAGSRQQLTVCKRADSDSLRLLLHAPLLTEAAALAACWFCIHVVSWG